MLSKALVTIIIPTYNRAHYLPEALESALQQTYPNLEIIVVNDGSTDNTEQVLSPYLKHIRYIKQENAGCAAAKNTGLAAATGEFITNLDDDDRILPEKISRQVEMFLPRKNLGLCATGVHFIDAGGRLIDTYMPPRFTPTIQVLQLLRKCVLVQSSVLIHRKCHDLLGNYKRMNAQDYDFWLRASLHFEIRVVKEYLTEYRCHGNQVTGAANRPKVKADVKELIRDFVARVPREQIIPGLCSHVYGDALIGLLLCEQKLFELAEVCFERVVPTPAGHFGMGLLKLHERRFDEAKACFELVEASDSPFALKVPEALQLSRRVQTIFQNPRNYHNLSPEVIQLRKDLSCFHATIIRLLFRLATGRPITLQEGPD